MIDLGFPISDEFLYKKGYLIIIKFDKTPIGKINFFNDIIPLVVFFHPLLNPIFNNLFFNPRDNEDSILILILNFHSFLVRHFEEGYLRDYLKGCLQRTVFEYLVLSQLRYAYCHIRGHVFYVKFFVYYFIIGKSLGEPSFDERNIYRILIIGLVHDYTFFKVIYI